MKRINITNIVEKALPLGVKSIFLFPGLPPLGNKRDLIEVGNTVLDNGSIMDALETTATPWQCARFKEEKELDYSYELEGLGRFRINAFSRMGDIGLVMRPVPKNIPPFASLGLPETLKSLINHHNGLVLITGPTGSGKSTTLASLLDLINQERSCHIVTIEDPIEFIYKPEKSIVSQREIGKDTKSFQEALKRVLREDPDVILVGEIRDSETMKVVIEMAETGHLVFSTLHTINVTQTINRILDMFPDFEKNMMRSQISQVLRGIVSQRLVQRIDGKGFACACEVMIATHPVKNLIKENKIQQIYSIMDVSKREGMISMDESLAKLYESGLIDMPEVISHSSKDKRFIERVVKETPKSSNVLMGRRGLDVEKDLLLYEADFSDNNLSYFDASGILMETPIKLLFRDPGHVKYDLHFIADYTILNGRKPAFPLKSLFSLSYRILNVKTEKRSYQFRLRIAIENKESVDIPTAPMELMKDNDWHTLTIPIPKIYIGRTIRYYMLMFDNDIKEIAFDAIRFL